MPRRYDPSNWYWVVGGQVYSSAAVAYVPTNDPTYQAWLAAGNGPTPLATEQELWDVLSAAGVAIPTTAGMSDAEKTREINNADRVLYKVAFNHENRIRALEGKAAITAAQFVTAIKAQL